MTRASAGRAALLAGLICLTGPGAACDEDEPALPALSVELPGAPAPDAALEQSLRQRWKVRPAGYRPRTRHLLEDGRPKYTNRLFLEISPYLRQHAHNPVNWYPWGDEAFEAAKRLGRPVFLSVGYSTCHWCHVMEEESFDDEEIARFLNEHYIAIKVDREERPDVDSVYMAAVQAMTGRGGWPMSVWLTPKREPFYGGTYFPARDGDRGANVGFLTLLQRLEDLYAENPAHIAQRNRQLVEHLRANLTPVKGSVEASATLDRAMQMCRARYDPVWGGNSGAPKFPSNLPLRFLMTEYRRTGNETALSMATHTLEKMAAGGIYDHVGGGFHRYATDQRWLVPHFEKMLYDNALLVPAYLDAYQITSRDDFRRVAEETLLYLRRDMLSPQGAFYSATDADSPDPEGHSEEGWFFTWTPAELRAVLGEKSAAQVAAYYGVSEAGNFEGRSILHTPSTPAAVAALLGVEEVALRATIDRARAKLYAERADRPAPLRDEKILTAWNGLAISAFARAGLVLGKDEYTAVARRAAMHVLRHARRDGRLYRSYKDGQLRHAGYLDDYAFLIAGLLDLFEADGDPIWLDEAVALDGVLQRYFEDPDNGGFFLTADDQERLLVREKPSYDGAVPSGNSVHALNLYRLAEFTTDDRYRRRADRTVESVGSVMSRAPIALSEMLLAVDFHRSRPREIILVARGSRDRAEPMLEVLRRTYLPGRVLIVAVEGEQFEAQRRRVPLLAGKKARADVTAYVCQAGVCALPTSDPAVFAEQLSKP